MKYLQSWTESHSSRWSHRTQMTPNAKGHRMLETQVRKRKTKNRLISLLIFYYLPISSPLQDFLMLHTAGTGKLLTVNGKMGEAKYKAIVEEKLLQAATDLRLGRRFTIDILLDRIWSGIKFDSSHVHHFMLAYLDYSIFMCLNVLLKANSVENRNDLKDGVRGWSRSDLIEVYLSLFLKKYNLLLKWILKTSGYTEFLLYLRFQSKRGWKQIISYAFMLPKENHVFILYFVLVNPRNPIKIHWSFRLECDK